jgi:hypothetical protein
MTLVYQRDRKLPMTVYGHSAARPSFSDLKSLSAVPPIPVMPRIDSHNGASCQT